jgi:EAL domain-containing protein (putative c-di-GMP-specific phosphodiesterase class I)
VEIEAQATWLIGAGCDELQGFLFGKPAPRDEVVETV